VIDVAKEKARKGKGKPISGNAVIRYLRGTRAELRKVHWPTREEAWNLTKIVMVVTVSMAILLGLLDYLFSLELRGIMSGNAIALGALVIVLVAGVLAAVILNRQAAR
jgi:preprotein translocase subunit SecE